MQLTTVSTIKGFSSSSPQWGVGGAVLSVQTRFFSNWSHYVVVDDCRSRGV